MKTNYPNDVDMNWKNKWPSLREYFEHQYDPIYYRFDKTELNIDPAETMDQIEAYDDRKKSLEFIKCAQSFPYFCHKYLKIAHPKRGLLPFILFNYQRKVIQEYESHRFNIIRKFRQGGLTTVTVLWCLWRCMFKLDETIMVVSKSDREAIAAGEIVKRAIEELPNWMAPEMEKNNDHQKFFVETGCKLFFYTPEAARGRSITYLIMDEAAFIPKMETFWKAIFPTISTGGNCIAISTVNGVGNWYEEMYHEAERGDNDFNIIDLGYKEHPDYNDPEWVRSTRTQLGEKGWLQEVMGDFLGAGDTWIPPDIINDYEQDLKQIEPARVLFVNWTSKLGENAKKNLDEGALYIWKEPIDGREYIIGVDAAEGIGAKGDNSCAQIIDASTCEQVAEFYSNTCPNAMFAQIIAQLGVLYNNALVAVENEKYGATVLDRLQNDLHYENIFHTVQGKSEKIGIKTTKSNRVLYLDAFNTRMLSKSLPLWSLRVLRECKTFVYNAQTKKPEAQNNGHDDAILAMSIALFVRDQQFRSAPVGADVPNEANEEYKLQWFNQIKEELEKGAPENWNFEEVTDTLYDYDEVPEAIALKFRRNYEALLNEFGW